jgi:tripartite ATP-independent transporter DctP family solute receptor
MKVQYEIQVADERSAPAHVALRYSTRRHFLAVASGALAAGLAAPVRVRAAAPPAVLRLGLANSMAAPFGQAAQAMVERIRAESDGRIQVDIYPGSALGAELELLHALERGSVDLCINATLSGFMPEFGIFDIPFLFRNVAHAHAVLDGPIGTAVLRKLETRNIVGLAWGENGLRHLTTSNRAVRNPADMGGLKIRLPQSEVMVAAFRALGAEPAPLSFSELYAALVSGRFEAQENPLGTIEGSGLYGVQKFLILTGHVYSAAGVLMSRHIFDRLAPADQDLLRRAAAEARITSRRAAAAAQQEGVERLRGRGMQVMEVDRAAFAAAANRAEATFAKMFGADSIAAIRAVGS